MKRKSKKSIDLFKERTLGCLALKDAGPGKYPINSLDLIHTKKCIVCGSSKSKILAEVYLKNKLNFLTTNVCSDCLFVFRSVSPSLKWFKKCWKKIKNKQPEIFNPEIEAIRKIRYERYYKMLSEHIGQGRVLDIGAGYGMGSKVFRDHGYDIEALEPEDNKAQYIKAVLNITTYHNSIESFLSIPLKKQYDLIIFAHCLEHLDNPSTVIAKLKKLLKPSGILYVEIPVLWNYVTWSDALYLTHKSNFGEEHIIRFVQNHGFTIIDTAHIRHSPKEPHDFGLILKADTNSSSQPKTINMTEEHTINTVFKLYRKNLPKKIVHPRNIKLIYRIPYIEQFYCGLKFENYKIVIFNHILTFIPKSK